MTELTGKISARGPKVARQSGALVGEGPTGLMEAVDLYHRVGRYREDARATEEGEERNNDDRRHHALPPHITTAPCTCDSRKEDNGKRGCAPWRVGL